MTRNRPFELNFKWTSLVMLSPAAKEMLASYHGVVESPET